MSANSLVRISLIAVFVLWQFAPLTGLAAARTSNGSAANNSRVKNAQEATVQKLLERGALDEALQRAERERDNPESTYLAAQALIKKDDSGRATEEYGRLREIGDE